MATQPSLLAGMNLSEYDDDEEAPPAEPEIALDMDEVFLTDEADLTVPRPDHPSSQLGSGTSQPAKEVDMKRFNDAYTTNIELHGNEKYRTQLRLHRPWIGRFNGTPATLIRLGYEVNHSGIDTINEIKIVVTLQYEKPTDAGSKTPKDLPQILKCSPKKYETALVEKEGSKVSNLTPQISLNAGELAAMRWAGVGSQTTTQTLYQGGRHVHSTSSTRDSVLTCVAKANPVVDNDSLWSSFSVLMIVKTGQDRPLLIGSELECIFRTSKGLKYPVVSGKRTLPALAVPMELLNVPRVPGRPDTERVCQHLERVDLNRLTGLPSVGAKFSSH